MSVVRLTPAKSASQDARENAIKILEDALQLAKEGQVSELVLIVKRSDGFWSEDKTTVTGFCEWIGRLEICKQAWVRSYIHENV